MTNKTKIKICNLADHKNYIPAVAEWIYNEWSRKHGSKLKDIIKRTKERSNKNKIPLSLIAFDSGELVGTVALWENDLKARKDLRPYLATLYVIPEKRKRGIGTKLMNQAIKEAKRLGEKRLYLITDLNGYYEKSGWKFLSNEATHYGDKVRVYELLLDK